MVGKAATIVGVLLSVGAAYLAASFNNIMDLLQLVFAFVNAPLFATFFLGMFWKRTTGHGAFAGLLTGMLAAMAHHGLTLPLGDAPGVHGGFFGVLVTYRSDLAQAFWTAIVAFVFCTITTIVVSVLTTSPDESMLTGLVYSLTPRAATSTGHWIRSPVTLAAAVGVAAVALNIWFF